MNKIFSDSNPKIPLTWLRFIGRHRSIASMLPCWIHFMDGRCFFPKLLLFEFRRNLFICKDATWGAAIFHPVQKVDFHIVLCLISRQATWHYDHIWVGGILWQHGKNSWQHPGCCTMSPSWIDFYLVTL